jgi:hypothetical protein
VPRADISFAPVARPQDLFDHPHLLANGSLAPTTLPGGVKTRLPLLPFQMLGWRPPLVSDPPEVGQHNDEVLAEIGYDEPDIAALKSAGIVTTLHGHVLKSVLAQRFGPFLGVLAGRWRRIRHSRGLDASRKPDGGNQAAAFLYGSDTVGGPNTLPHAFAYSTSHLCGFWARPPTPTRRVIGTLALG